MSKIVEKISSELRNAYRSKLAAVNQAKSLKIISSDIYTEEERFLYELLQNAVDSFADTGKDDLDIKISLSGDYLAFMHNGAAFSDADVEGICGVGNGTKANDAKKIGYKGIGFKSVFAHSDKVIIKSGEHCFSFDKPYWQSHADFEMPWQIIPLNAEIPHGQLYDEKYTVCTYIKTKNTKIISSTISRLLSDSDFLLFLGCKNASIVYYNGESVYTSLKKVSNGGKVTLYKNDVIDSCWLVHNIDPLDAIIPAEVKSLIAEDDNTPEKLKESTTFDLSFAISLDKNSKLEPIKESVLYTYLPTSATMGFPFLVNANFITDAGRQQLHKNSEWNKFLIGRIPFEYLKWIATISRENDNYFKVLPLPMDTSSPLDIVFNDALSQAINTIAFIPAGHEIRKAIDVFIDRMGIASLFSSSIVAKHINRSYGKSFDEGGLIESKGITVFKKYGVFVFDKDCLKNFFDDGNALSGLTVDDDEKLVRYLYAFYADNESDRSNLIETLKATCFLLEESGKISTPLGMLFPSDYYENKDYIEKASILNSTLFDSLKGDTDLVKWLSLLGVEEISNLSVIRNVICNEDFVTKDNAIDVGRFLFKVSQKEDLFGEIALWQLQQVKFLTVGGTLRSINDLYLSHDYNPDIDLEPVHSKDIYVSGEYVKNESLDEWKVFFKKMGVSSSFEMKTIRIKRQVAENSYPVLQKAIEPSEKVGYHSYNGNTYYFHCQSFDVKYYPLIDIQPTSDQHDIGKLLWSNVLTRPKPIFSNASDYIRGRSYLVERSLELCKYNGNECFAKYVLANMQHFPSVRGAMLLAGDIFINSSINSELAGNHLHILDIDGEVDDSWYCLLQFKRDLTLDDLLQVLSSIADEDCSSEKDRISKIYHRIIENYNLCSHDIQEKLHKWGEKNHILSNDGSFKSPSELSHVTLDGFASRYAPFTGDDDASDEVIELLQIMGLTVITRNSIKTTIKGKVENEPFALRLKSVISPLALIKCNSDSERYAECKDELLSIIDSSRFYQCDSITLTYGDKNDTLEKNTFALDGQFHYTSTLRAATIEPLLSPLCKFLNLKGKERELFILLIEQDLDGIRKNLKEKGYNVEILEDSQESLPPLLGYVSTDVIDENEKLKKRITALEEHLNEIDANGTASVCRGEYQSLAQKQRIEAQLEAQRYLKAIKPDWVFPKGYGEVDEDGSPYCDTRLRVQTPVGKQEIVLKSHKNQSAPFKITVLEWDYISNYQAKIFVYTGSDIKEIAPYDLIRNQSSVSISFSTKNLYVEEKIQEFAQAMHYFKELHFDFESFDISTQAASIRSKYNK